MKLLVRWLALLALFVSPSAWAAGKSYSGLYVFGDSLVDSGNAYSLTKGAQPSAAYGYYDGRFSNGFNFADYLSEMISGKPTTALFQGGLNIAVGGATAAYVPGNISGDFATQLQYYDAMVGKTVDPNALVLITFGGNDVRATKLQGGAANFSAAAKAMTDGLTALYAAGARNVVIVGSPDIGLLPDSVGAVGAVPGRLAELTARSEQLNLLLSGVAAAFGTQPGAAASYFDLFSYEHDLLASPAKYGLPSTLNTTTPCITAPGTCANALYFDSIHPTTQVHQAIARALAGQLGISAVPESQIWVMLILGFGAVGVSLRRRRRATMSLA